MDMIEETFRFCISQLELVRQSESGSIATAADWVAQTVTEDRGFYLFGSGHSAFIARDAWWRAGGLASAFPIFDPLVGDAERMEGYAALLLAHYDLTPGGVMVVISNSGINPLPIEVALESQARRLRVIALTSRAHSIQVASRHSSGKKLMDIADLVIDTHGIPGDAALELPGTGLKVAPTSTVVGAAIVQAICAGAAARLADAGIRPPVVVSMNMPQGDAWNAELAEKYGSKIVRYEIPAVGGMKK